MKFYFIAKQCSPLPATVTNVGQFDQDIMLRAFSTVLRVINPQTDIPEKLPAAMAARYRVCASVASSLQDLGFQGEIGYQNILYPVAQDTRKIFGWLLNQLPKHGGAEQEEQVGMPRDGVLYPYTAGAGDAFRRQLVTALASSSRQLWEPRCIRKAKRSRSFAAWRLDTPCLDEESPEAKHFYNGALKTVTDQPPVAVSPAVSVLEHRCCNLRVSGADGL